MWRQEWAMMNKAYNALYRAHGLYKAVAAVVRVPAVPADFERLSVPEIVNLGWLRRRDTVVVLIVKLPLAQRLYICTW